MSRLSGISESSAIHTSPIESFHVKHIRIYPVKSCQGMELDECRITKWGLEHDRRWAIVGKEKVSNDETKWHVENIFEMKPELARIKPVIEDALGGGHQLRLSAHGHADIVLPVRTEAGQRPNLFLQPLYQANPSIDHAEDEGEAAAEWVTNVLTEGEANPNHTFHLVWMPPDVSAKCAEHPKYGHLFNREDEMSFAAKSQYLVTNEASLDSLNESIKSMGDDPVKMTRFRPNFVFAGQAWEEETWKVVRIGHDLILRTCMSAIRCVETTVEMEEHAGGWGGERDSSMQPFKALKKFHAGHGGKPRFGMAMNRCLAGTVGEPIVKVGDHVTVVEHQTKDWSTVDMTSKRASVVAMTRPNLRASVINEMADQIEQVADASESGDGTLANTGIKCDGEFQCDVCRQKFTSLKALMLHKKYFHGDESMRQY